ncbi:MULTISPECIES: hypothetical protein [unclassified Paraburkholderia]|uniref:hypothetical protein n=1 Tax=unclassified Paraburkholderia TaxID=2615204 RepID=UPI002AB17222|nr:MULTISPECIES: hypothetical protein [unclassified Paraburkholderia]
MTALQWQMLSMRGPALPERPTVNSRGRPHDESVLILRRIAGREGIGKLFEYRVEATARASFLPMIFDEDERTRIDLDRIAGTPNWRTIDLERVEDSRDPTRIVTSSSGAGVREINGIAVLISLSAFAGIASAQNAENGIQNGPGTRRADRRTRPQCAGTTLDHAIRRSIGFHARSGSTCEGQARPQRKARKVEVQGEEGTQPQGSERTVSIGTLRRDRFSLPPCNTIN